MAEVGLIIDKTDYALYFESAKKSLKQETSDKVTKRDLLINFRKPRPGEGAQELIITGNEDKKTFLEKVKVIIIDHLSRHSGTTMDRVYDDVVSKMVRRGEFERHNFKEILTQVAEESEGRWYLKETAEEVDAAEQTKEDKAAQRLEMFMERYLKEHPHQSGVHYSDLFEQCLVIPKEDKPRRLLQEWMWDYFFKTHEGTWRPPLTAEEREQKAGVRQSGLLRRIKRFTNALMEGTPIRQKDRPENDATLAEWVRECRRAGLYDHGRVLYEKGGIKADSLDEESRLELEEDYAVCVRRQLKESKGKR
jgi:hypothetical protein